MFRFIALTTSLLILLFVAAGCDDPASSNPPPRWEITLGGAGDDVPLDVARIGGETFVVAGWSQEPGSSQKNAYIAVVDGKDGSLRADTLLSGDTATSANCIFVMAQDKFVVGGSCGRRAMLLFMDLSASIDSMYLFDPPDEQSTLEINGIDFTRYDGFVLAGTYTKRQHPIPTIYSSWLAYAENGDSLSSSQLLPGKGISRLDGKWFEHNGFVWSNAAAEYACDPGQPCDISDICFGMCDEYGDTTWLKTIPGPDAEFAVGVYTGASNLMVTGSDGSDIWLGAFWEDGSELDSRTFADTTGVTWASDIDLGPGSTYILCGGIREYDWSDTDALLVKLDAHTDIIWQKRFGGDQYDEAIRVLPLAWGYLILGNTASKGAGGRDIWLIRTDLDGRME